MLSGQEVLMTGMNMEIKDLVFIYCNNTSAINISKNPVMHTKTKQIAIKYHFLRELVQDKEVGLEYVNAKEKIANIFKNLVMHTKTKHIAIKYYFLRDLVHDKEMRLEYVNTKE